MCFYISSSSLLPSTYPGPLLHFFTLGYFAKAESSGLPRAFISDFLIEGYSGSIF